MYTKKRKKENKIKKSVLIIIFVLIYIRVQK